MPTSSSSLSGSRDAFRLSMRGTARPSPLQFTHVTKPFPSQNPHLHAAPPSAAAGSMPAPRHRTQVSRPSPVQYGHLARSATFTFLLSKAIRVPVTPIAPPTKPVTVSLKAISAVAGASLAIRTNESIIGDILRGVPDQDDDLRVFWITVGFVLKHKQSSTLTA